MLTKFMLRRGFVSGFPGGLNAQIDCLIRGAVPNGVFFWDVWVPIQTRVESAVRRPLRNQLLENMGVPVDAN